MKTASGPRSFFGLKNVRAFSGDTLNFILRLQREYGDVSAFRMGPYQAFFFYHPDHVKEILSVHWKALPKLKRQVDVLAQWDGNGLLLSEGDFWLRQRRLVQPAFSVSRFENYAALMVRRTQGLLQRWQSRSEISLDEQMRFLTLEIISEALFGAEVSDRTVELEKAVLILSEISVTEFKQAFIRPSWLPTSHNKRKKWAMATVDKTVRQFIADRRKSGKDAGDLLSMLLLAVPEEGQDVQGGMTDEQARDEAMVLFLAGHDTTATALIWTWYLLAQNPEVERKVIEEVDLVLAGRPATYEDVGKLGYLKQVIKESLRLYPPAVGNFARQATSAMEIGGYSVPKGAFVYTFSYATQRDPRWFSDPLVFDPDRFASEKEKTMKPFSYFPFGGGPRVCIGLHFAMMEMALVIATILQRYRLVLMSGQTIVPEVRLSLTPKEPIRMRLESRQSGEDFKLKS